MPKMRGDELLDHMIERCMSVPAVFLTGHDSTGTVAHGDLSNKAEVLAKPVAFDDQLRAIRDALEDSVHA